MALNNQTKPTTWEGLLMKSDWNVSFVVQGYHKERKFIFINVIFVEKRREAENVILKTVFLIIWAILTGI